MNLKEIFNKKLQLFSYLVTDEIPVFVTVHLSVLLKHAVLDSCTHEVEVALAGCKTATHGGSRLSTMITPLEIKVRNTLLTLTLLQYQ